MYKNQLRICSSFLLKKSQLNSHYTQKKKKNIRNRKKKDYNIGAEGRRHRSGGTATATESQLRSFLLRRRSSLSLSFPLLSCKTSSSLAPQMLKREALIERREGGSWKVSGEGRRGGCGFGGKVGFDDESVRRSGGLKTDDTWSKKLELMEVMSRTRFLYIEIEFIKLDFYM